MRSFARVPVLVLTFAALGACGSDRSTGPTSAVNGSWTGIATFQGYDFTITADLKHTRGDTIVSGMGTIGTGGSSIPLTVDGVFKAPAVSLTFSNPDYESVNYTGTVSSNTMTGVLDGSGFDSVAVTLTRK